MSYVIKTFIPCKFYLQFFFRKHTIITYIFCKIYKHNSNDSLKCQITVKNSISHQKKICLINNIS